MGHGHSRGGHRQPESYPYGAGGASAEPLEAYLREKQRNDHLKNLGAKRQTSFRRSIRKKLKKVTGSGSSSSKHKHEPGRLDDQVQTEPDLSVVGDAVDKGGGVAEGTSKPNCDINAISKDNKNGKKTSETTLASQNVSATSYI